MPETALLEVSDPNTHWTETTVEITVQQWAYTAQLTAKCGGNCSGLTVIEAAITSIYEDLLGDKEIADVELHDSDGNSLLVEDDEDSGEEWLRDMVVSARIISREPETRTAKGRNA